MSNFSDLSVRTEREGCCGPGSSLSALQVTDAAGESSESVTARVQEMDEEVQKAIMTGAGEEATMTSTVNSERTAAKQLAAKSSEVAGTRGQTECKVRRCRTSQQFSEPCKSYAPRVPSAP